MIDTTKKPHRRTELDGEPFEPFAIAATAGNDQHKVGARLFEQRYRTNCCVETFARHESADANNDLG